MRSIKYVTVDVFCKNHKKFTGNPLAVFLDADELTSEMMQCLARETNYSETTFVMSQAKNSDGSVPVRIFTPTVELPFAGHPTLGTAFVIREFHGKDVPDKVTLDLKAGKVPVWTEPAENGTHLYFMKQPTPSFGASVERQALEPFVSLHLLHPDFSPAIVSTGIPFAIVPLNSEADVQALQPSFEEVSRFSRAFGVTGILFFAPRQNAAEPEFAVRVFVPEVGVMEDPATGSANGCFAAWLLNSGWFGGADSISAKSIQGVEMGRPSELFLRAERNPEGQISVEVGGSVVAVFSGETV